MNIDVFIEINAHYSHGTHRFGTDPTDKQLLEELKKKVEKIQNHKQKIKFVYGLNQTHSR